MNPIFKDKAARPSDADLKRVLGGVKRHWDGLVAHLVETYPAAPADWKHYSTGWTFVARGKRRNLVYLTPYEKSFLASFAFSPQAVAAAERADIPAEVLEAIRRAPLYPEGRAVRITVAGTRDLAVVRKLLAIRFAT